MRNLITKWLRAFNPCARRHLRLRQTSVRRLHDYGSDNPELHIISLKILELERIYSEAIQAIREKLLYLDLANNSDELTVEISDFSSDTNERGFPKFGLFVSIRGCDMFTEMELPFDSYNSNLIQELDLDKTEKKEV